jgi:hypothetical protein
MDSALAVIPARAGTRTAAVTDTDSDWIPGYAGMTEVR